MQHKQLKSIDLGCGPNKLSNCYGVDKHPYDGVDQVFDLDQSPWPLENNHYERIYARHVIEHVADIPAFLGEIHRIAAPGATIEFVTPHFSSIHSWQDPTHRWHLASGWHKTFTEDYMASQVERFNHISTNINFSSSLRSRVGRMITKIAGLDYWEKHYAFIFRARNITTVLEAVK